MSGAEALAPQAWDLKPDNLLSLLHLMCDLRNYVHPTREWTYYICFFSRPPSGVRHPTWFPDILGNSSYPIFTKFGMQVYWVNSLYGIAFGDDSSIAN